MAACSLFEEDEVYVHKPGKGYIFGLVLENSEFLSSSEEDEAELPEDRLHKGTVRVAWHPSGKETVLSEDKVHLLDRSLMPGDVVRRLIPGEKSQCGFVMDMDVRCHLHVLRTNKYIYSVDSKNLVPIQKFESGQEVMWDSWLGRVDSVTVHVILVFPDGARCQVDENDIYPFDDVSEKRIRHGEFSVCLYYPGQELKGPFDCLSDAKWLLSTPRFCHKMASKKGKNNIVHVTIEKIVNKSIEVHWLFRGYEQGDNSSQSVSPPPGVVEGDDVERLRVLDWFHHCSIQIGDRMFYRIRNDDVVSTVEPGKVYSPCSAVMKDEPIKISRAGNNKSGEEQQGNSAAASGKEDGNDIDFEDVDEDESDSDEKQGACGGRCAGGGRGGRKRIRNPKIMGHRHVVGKPGQFPKSGNRKRGPRERLVRADEVIEVETEFTMSWATVMWQDGSVERDIPSVELFPVHHLDDLEFFPGDFVVPNIELSEPADYGVVVKVDHEERTCLIHWFRAYDVGKAAIPTLMERNCEMSVYDIKDHPDYKFRPGQSVVRVGGFENISEESNHTPQGVGQIFELDPNGHLVVKWADGSISQCYPQEVFIVSDDADDASDNNSLDSWESESDYETDGSGSTWETESEQEIMGEDSAMKADKDDSGYDQGALCEHKQELDSLLGRAETALVRLQKLLNNFDVPAVPVPECFHDIIRIYRSCHDLDKILQSSYFADSELQTLISQAKKELRRDRANKISRHLSQLFEAWSNSLPAEDTENVGTVAFGSKTIKIGALRKGASVEVSLQVPTGDGDNTFDKLVSVENTSATMEDTMFEGGDNSVITAVVASPAGSSLCGEESKFAGIKKETSEPAISRHYENSELGSRRPSDSSNDINTTSDARNKKKYVDVNLVGENCVSKAAKRTKSEAYDDSGHEAKKSRDETAFANHVAQELCFKICQNLQKQILKIHEDVNKRIKRLITVPGKPDDDVIEGQSNAAVSQSLVASDNPCGTMQTDSEQCYIENASVSNQCDEYGRWDGQISTELEEDQSHPGLTVTPLDSVPHSMDESGEKYSVGARVATAAQAALEEAGDNNCQREEEGSVTLEDVKAVQVPCKGFDMCDEVQSFHKFVSHDSQPGNPRAFRAAVAKELKLFQSSLPDGIFIKGFEDRLDLYSVMILGPEGTPYEDALFLFDIMLPNDYPNSPPVCHYHSYCNDRLNPNLYEDGKVCVSLLGTWSGKGTEVWTSKSSLLQVLVSIQGLILVPEPYYNEAGYERQRGTQVGQENSRMYNEMVILKTLQSLTRMCHSLPALFKHEIYHYLKSHGPRMIARLRHWMEMSENERWSSLTLQPHHQQGIREIRQHQSSSTEAQQLEMSENSAFPKLPEQFTISVDKALQNGQQDAFNPLFSADQCNHGSPCLKNKDANAHSTQNIINSAGISPVQIQAADALDGDGNPVSSSVDTQFSEAIQAVNALNINSPGSFSHKHFAHLVSNVAIEKPLCHLSGEESHSESVPLSSGVKVMVVSSDVMPQLPIGLSVSPLSSYKDTSLITGSPVDVELVASDTLPKNPSSTVIPGSSKSDHVTEAVSTSAKGSSMQAYLESQNLNFHQPEFSLFPMSRGFCLTLQKFLTMYEKALQELNTSVSC